MIFLKLLRESFIFAFQAIIMNKVRTLLTLLGITIGIFSIIAVFTVFDSLENTITSRIESLGDDVLFVEKWPWAMGGDYPWWKYWQRPETNLDDLKEIQKRSTTVDYAAYLTATSRTVKFKSNSIESVEIWCVSHDFDKVLPFDLEDGRYFTPLESNNGRNVVIIGADIADNLFQGEDALGKNIKIFGRNLNVIGIIKREGKDIFDDSSDERAIIPINYFKGVVDLHNRGGQIIVKAKAGITKDEMRDELTGVMRAVRKLKPSAEDNFAINETDVITQGFEEVFSVIGMVGWIIGGFSLLVGGFGIANIMFVSVKERTSQIGIQKSLGAKNYFILFQFLFEAIFLAIFGGIVGLGLVFGMVAIVNSMDFLLTLTLTQGNIILAISVSALIGLVSGFVPAYSAARLDPVEAMRSTF